MGNAREASLGGPFLRLEQTRYYLTVRVVVFARSRSPCFVLAYLLRMDSSPLPGLWPMTIGCVPFFFVICESAGSPIYPICA